MAYQFRERAFADILASRLNVLNLPFDDYDQRVRVQVEDEAAESLKAQIAALIHGADYVVCLVGPTTATSSWVNWELTMASELGKMTYAVKLADGVTMPPAVDPRVARVVRAEVDEIPTLLRPRSAAK